MLVVPLTFVVTLAQDQLCIDFLLALGIRANEILGVGYGK